MASGRYASVSEIVRAGLRALERQQMALDAILKAKVEAALADPSPSIAPAQVFADLRASRKAQICVKAYTVVWRPQARDDLLALYEWIAEQADPDTAFEYAGKIEAHATKLAAFPERGTPRDDLAVGIRTPPIAAARLSLIGCWKTR